jgi:hypothetical protein
VHLFRPSSNFLAEAQPRLEKASEKDLLFVRKITIFIKGVVEKCASAFSSNF